MDELVVNQAMLTSPLDQKRRTPPTDIDRDRAARLRGHVTRQNKLKSYSPRRWEDSFRILRERMVDAGSTIDDVLNWLIRTNPPKPTIYDAVEFRTQFGWLERLMKSTPVPVTVGPAAKRIADGLAKRYHWPRDSAAQLPEAAQRSLDAYVKWRERLRAIVRVHYARTSTPTAELGRLAQNLLDTFARPDDFVTEWFRRYHKSVANWREWSGRVVPFAPDNPQFTAQCLEAADRVCGNRRVWDRLQMEFR